MTGTTDKQTWVIEEGDRIIRKKSSSGFDALTTWEKRVGVRVPKRGTAADWGRIKASLDIMFE